MNKAYNYLFYKLYKLFELEEFHWMREWRVYGIIIKKYIYLLACIFIASCQQDRIVVGEVEQVLTTPWNRGGNVLKYMVSYNIKDKKDSTILIGNNIYKKYTHERFFFQKGDSLVIKLSPISGLYHFNSFLKIHSLVEREKKKPIMVTSRDVEKGNKNVIKEDWITKIKVMKINFNIVTVIPIDCDNFLNERSEITISTIEDKDTICQIMGFIDSLQKDEINRNTDVRAKMLIYHKNNLVDTLCMSKYEILYNGESYKINKNLLELIENL